ncbi:MAG: cell division protein ZapB [Desulfuromonadaceae bacterium]|nr:cell division protein ZapB [Desulfuromonadaceae bacterium]
MNLENLVRLEEKIELLIKRQQHLQEENSRLVTVREDLEQQRDVVAQELDRLIDKLSFLDQEPD